MWWKNVIVEVMKDHGDSWENVEAIAGDITIDPYDHKQVLHRPQWTVWTHDRVYFPEEYDGDYRSGSVPRHPSNEAVPASWFQC